MENSSKEIFIKALMARRIIQSHQRRREQYLALATGMSGMSETAIRSTGKRSRVESAALALVELADRMEQDADQLAQAILKAERLIAALERPRHREVLTLRYIEGKSWRQITEAMGYQDEKSAFRVHGWALQAADEAMRKLHSRM